MTGKSLSLLIQESSNLIGDGSTYFGTDVLTEWINFAISDLNQHFPRIITVTHNCVTDQHEYDLAENFLAPISVEYPDGEDPPRFLLRKAYTFPNFYNLEGFYDVLLRQDANVGVNPSQLILSEAPVTGEDIVIIHSAVHNALSAPNDETTIFDRHTHLIALFVRWKAHSELSTTEGMDPDPVKLLTATIEVNAYRAERAYYDALRRAKLAESESARIEHWPMDKWDQTY